MRGVWYKILLVTSQLVAFGKKKRIENQQIRLLGNDESDIYLDTRNMLRSIFKIQEFYNKYRRLFQQSYIICRLYSVNLKHTTGGAGCFLFIIQSANHQLLYLVF